MAGISFSEDFLWGTASAAYQVEGAWNQDDKGESIWDRFCHTPGKIKDGDTGDVACNFYHRYRDDIALMKAMGLNAARISVSWPRIIPGGTGKVNRKGIDFYNRVIDELLRHGLKPFVTLYHWDLPQKMEDIGGWPNRMLADHFRDYVEVVARKFGDRVKHWIVFNEPWVFTVLGYLVGIHAPGRCEPAEALKATHVVNVAQGMAIRALRENARPEAVGTAFSMQPCYPKTDSEEDRAAAGRFDRFLNFWFLDPVMKGTYPEIFVRGKVEDWVDIKPRDMELVKTPLDFVGINLYTRIFVTHNPDEPHIAARPAPMGDGRECTDFGWEVYPAALSEMILRVTREYGRPAIYVTENGCSYGDGPGPDGKVHDHRRIVFLRRYIAEMGRAIAMGADVRGYFTWTFTDNFEWAEGYSQRFGIVYCDFHSQHRIVKDSGHWYSALARSGRFDSAPDE